MNTGRTGSSVVSEDTQAPPIPSETSTRGPTQQSDAPMEASAPPMRAPPALRSSFMGTPISSYARSLGTYLSTESSHGQSRLYHRTGRPSRGRQRGNGALLSPQGAAAASRPRLWGGTSLWGRKPRAPPFHTARAATRLHSG